jgi:hypothetical protein
VQERKKKLSAKARGKQVESALITEGILSANSRNEESIVNFYTSARAIVHPKIYNLNHVLVDAGSVVNLAPMSVLEAIRAPLQKSNDLVIRTATSNLVPIDWFTELDIEVGGVTVPLRIYAIPPHCEPTYALLLSRRWLRACSAIGDYASGTYVIKDKLGRTYQVPPEYSGKPHTSMSRPSDLSKVQLNPDTANVSLDDETVAEFELDSYDSISISALACRIAEEVNEELLSYNDHEGDFTSTSIISSKASSDQSEFSDQDNTSEDAINTAGYEDISGNVRC